MDGVLDANGAQTAAFFDLDKTLIAKASMAAFRRPFRRRGLLTRRALARIAAMHLAYLHFGADEQHLTKIRESALALTKGWDRALVRSVVREALLETVEPILYAEALELVGEHRRHGDRVYLLSTSPEEVVLPLAELLGADRAIASRAEVDSEGRYTGALAFYASGPGKAQALRELADDAGLDLSRSTAYSDSITDLPMLEAVGRPVAVNPDRALRTLARRRGWEVLEFTKPVRLRNRISPRLPAIGAGVAAGVAALAWRHARRVRLGGRALRLP